MPTYQYECRECNYQFESFSWVEDRMKPTKEKMQNLWKQKKLV